MVVRTRLSQFESSVLLTPVQAIGTPTVPALFPINGQNADGTTTAGVDGYLGTSKFYNLVDALGNRLVLGVGAISSVFTPHAAVQYRNFVRYCENPGDRLFTDVKFDVNGNPLDQYDETVPMMLHKFCLAPNKVVGYNRLIGQQNAHEGTGPLVRGIVVDADVTTAGVANTPAGINLALQGHGNALFNNPPPGAVAVPAPQPANPTQPTNSGLSDYQPNPQYPGGPLPTFGSFNPTSNILPFATLNSTPSPVVDYSQAQTFINDGPQTPKPAQPPLEIWNKLRFWFNEDVRLAIASVSIPFGQRFITIEMAPSNLLAFEFCNLYLETIIDIAATPIVAGPPFYPTTNVSQHIVTYTPIAQQGVPDGPSVERMELYVNNIFVNPEVKIKIIASVLPKRKASPVGAL